MKGKRGRGEKMKPDRPKPRKTVEPLPELDDFGRAVLHILKHHGTDTQGPEYKLHQQAQVITQLVFELEEARALTRDFQYVKVIPST